MFSPDIGRITSRHFMYNMERITFIRRGRPLPLWHRHRWPRLPCQRRRRKTPRRKNLLVVPHCLFLKFKSGSHFPEKNRQTLFLNFQENCFFQLLQNHFLFKDNLEHSGRVRERDQIFWGKSLNPFLELNGEDLRDGKWICMFLW